METQNTAATSAQPIVAGFPVRGGETNYSAANPCSTESTGSHNHNSSTGTEENTNPVSPISPIDPTQSKADIVLEALAAAKHSAELREFAIRSLREQLDSINNSLMELGAEVADNGNETRKPTLVAPAPAVRRASFAAPARPEKSRFQGIALSEVGRILLQEKEVLKGQELERLARAGGYTCNTKNMQNYIPVAFRRAGGFENTGNNTWRLNDSIKPKR